MPDEQTTEQRDCLWNIFGEDQPLALIAADVDRVQSYVFESAKLAEMRGASLILDLLNVKETDDEDRWGNVKINGLKGIPQILSEEFGLQKECLIYAAGGGALIVAPLEKAEAIKQRIEKLYVKTTLTATITVVYEPIRLRDLEQGIASPELAEWFITKGRQATGEAWRLLKHNLVETTDWNQRDKPTSLTDEDYIQRKGFGERHTALGYKLRQAKQHRPTVPLFEVSPFSERCSYCHFRPACRLAPEIDERPICQACYRKRQDHDGRAAHSFYLKRFWDYLQREAEGGNTLPYLKGLRSDTSLANWTDVESPPDLKAVAGAGSSRVNNFVGIIYADGNNMGREIDRLTTVAEFRSFAREVRHALEQAVFSGLGNLLDSHRTAEPEYQDRKGKKRSRNINHHPFEIVSIGGDDVYLFVPADVALEMALHLCRKFEDRLHDRHLTLAAGVLIAHVNTSVYFSYQIVKGLLKSAKHLSKQGAQTISAMDFQVITADTAISENIPAFREQAYRNKLNEGLTTRPLKLNELEQMVNLVRALKRALKQDEFPKTQLYALRDAVVRGPQPRATNFYYYQQARSAEMKDRYAKLHSFLSNGKDDKRLPFWKPDDGDSYQVSPIVDLLEIYDFIREKSPSDQQEQK